MCFVQPRNVQFQKISILPPRKVFGLNPPPPPPPGNSNLFSYIASKNLVVKNPLPLGISNDLPWSGYRFLELHNAGDQNTGRETRRKRRFYEEEEQTTPTKKNTQHSRKHSKCL